MKTIVEYYKDLSPRINKISFGDKWWKADEYLESVSEIPEGDYLETTIFLDRDVRNDVPIICNKTNVKNSELCIMFDVMAQVLIDWCSENQKTDIWSIGIEITKKIDDRSPLYGCSLFVNDCIIVNIDDVYDGCVSVLSSVVDWFMTRFGNDMPLDWNRFYFSLDALCESVKEGKWVSESDGYLNISCFRDGVMPIEFVTML